VQRLAHPLTWILAGLLLPLSEFLSPGAREFIGLLRPLLIFIILGLGLNVVLGYCGLLHLGSSAFMAIGAYVFAIVTTDVYPFQLGFWGGWFTAIVFAIGPGILLGMPTLRLKGDYFAIVTLSFGEIVSDTLRNLEPITKGTQGLSSLPRPSLSGYQFTPESVVAWYYFLLVTVIALIIALRSLERSSLGWELLAAREDDLAASSVGIAPFQGRLFAFVVSSMICAGGGALWASYLGSSGEPGNYDFQISTLVLCAVVVGGIGNVYGVVLGTLVMMGFNSIVLVKLSSLVASSGIGENGNAFLTPNNYKYAVFGVALIAVSRSRPSGILKQSPSLRLPKS
jgi:branched-chain amino acid transport system permease protein